MISEGLKLTMLGMGVVFCFLVLLLLLIHVSSKLLAPFTEKELSPSMSEKPGRSVKKPSSSSPGGHLKSNTDTSVTVGSAAVGAHRARTRR